MPESFTMTLDRLMSLPLEDQICWLVIGYIFRRGAEEDYDLEEYQAWIGEAERVLDDPTQADLLAYASQEIREARADTRVLSQLDALETLREVADELAAEFGTDE